MTRHPAIDALVAKRWGRLIQTWESSGAPGAGSELRRRRREGADCLRTVVQAMVFVDLRDVGPLTTAVIARVRRALSGLRHVAAGGRSVDVPAHVQKRFEAADILRGLLLPKVERGRPPAPERDWIDFLLFEVIDDPNFGGTQAIRAEELARALNQEAGREKYDADALLKQYRRLKARRRPVTMLSK